MRTCSCALFVRDGRILLGRRSPAKAWFPGVWDLIGGHAAAGETPEEAFLREIKEEIGSKPVAYSLFDTLVYRELRSGESYQFYIFLVEGWAGPDPYLKNHEHVELRWFTPAEARDLELADPAYRELFARIEARRPPGEAYPPVNAG